MKAYKITNCEGRTGRAWMGVYDTPGDAMRGIARQYGWETVVVSEWFATVDGNGDESRACCAYETQEQCDEDNLGAYAPRICEVDA